MGSFILVSAVSVQMTARWAVDFYQENTLLSLSK